MKGENSFLSSFLSLPYPLLLFHLPSFPIPSWLSFLSPTFTLSPPSPLSLPPSLPPPPSLFLRSLFLPHPLPLFPSPPPSLFPSILSSFSLSHRPCSLPFSSSRSPTFLFPPPHLLSPLPYSSLLLVNHSPAEEDRCQACSGAKVARDRKVLEVKGCVRTVGCERTVGSCCWLMIQVHVDKGVKDGHKITFRGESNQVGMCLNRFSIKI